MVQITPSLTLKTQGYLSIAIAIIHASRTIELDKELGQKKVESSPRNALVTSWAEGAVFFLVSGIELNSRFHMAKVI